MRFFVCALPLLALSQVKFFIVESFVGTTRPTRTRQAAAVSTRLLLSSPLESSDGDKEEKADYSREETLLCIDFAVQPGVAFDEAVAKVSKFCQSFPFAAVLPVQPLHYMPVYEDGGVEVKFLRKKTVTKSSVDGGIRFFIEAIKGDDEDEGDAPTIEVTAKRNSRGQFVTKLVAEKLVVTNFVSGITGDEEVRYGKPPTDFVQVRSIYHKWM